MTSSVLWRGSPEVGGVNALAICCDQNGRATVVLGSGLGGCVIAVNASPMTSTAEKKQDSCCDWYELGLHSGYVSCVVAVCDLVYTGSFDGSVRSWRWQQQTRQDPSLVGLHDGPVHDLTFDRECCRPVYSVGSDCTLRVWEHGTVESTDNFASVVWSFEYKTYSCEFLVGADCIACGLHDGTIAFIRPSPCECIRLIEGHTGIVTAIESSCLPGCEAGKPMPALVTTSRDETVRVWDQDGRCVAVATREVLITETSLTSDSLQESLASGVDRTEHGDRMYCVITVAGGRSLLTGGTDGILRRWSLSTGALEHEYHSHTACVFGLARDESTGCLLSCSADRTVRAWQPSTQCEFCPHMCSTGVGCRMHEAKAKDISFPGVPLQVDAHVGNRCATLTWKEPDDNGGSDVASYIISCQEQSGETRLVEVDGSVTSHKVEDLRNGLSYEFRVAAKNERGKGPDASPKLAIPITQPEAPASFACQVDFVTGNVKLSWSSVESGYDGGSQVTAYVVHWQKDNTSCSEDIHAQGTLWVGLVLETEFCGSIDGLEIDSPLIWRESYKFSVSATNAAGRGRKSPQVAATPMPPKSLPGAPRKLHACKVQDVTHSSMDVREVVVRLSWLPPKADGGCEVLAYKVTINSMCEEADICQPSGGDASFSNFERSCFVHQSRDDASYLDLGLGWAMAQHVGEDLHFGNGTPPALELPVKLMADSGRRYSFTVAAVTQVGTGDQAPSLNFGSFADSQPGRSSMMTMPLERRGSLPRLSGAPKAPAARKASPPAGRAASKVATPARIASPSTGRAASRGTTHDARTRTTRQHLLPRITLQL